MGRARNKTIAPLNPGSKSGVLSKVAGVFKYYLTRMSDTTKAKTGAFVGDAKRTTRLAEAVCTRRATLGYLRTASNQKAARQRTHRHKQVMSDATMAGTLTMLSVNDLNKLTPLPEGKL